MAKHQSIEGMERMLSRMGHSWGWEHRGFLCSPATPAQAIRDSNYQWKKDRKMEYEDFWSP